MHLKNDFLALQDAIQRVLKNNTGAGMFTKIKRASET
jgi:hypothetical protein